MSNIIFLSAFFRLNTKGLLFWGSQENISKEFTPPSPGILGKIFFSSPLVLFPNNFLVDMLCKPYKDVQNAALQTLHFIIQLSSYYFPHAYWLLLSYLKIKGIDSYAAVKQYLFPDGASLEEFSQKMKPLIFEPKKEYLTSNTKELYAKTWRNFSPSDLYSTGGLKCLSLYEWKSQGNSVYYTDQDYTILKKIQDTLL